MSGPRTQVPADAQDIGATGASVAVTTRPSPADDDACPCGSAHHWGRCCGPALDHGRQPATAEALMRSRYSAYVLQRVDWLLSTWHPDTRPDALPLDQGPPMQWLGLKVKAHRPGPEPGAATVQFVARFRVLGSQGGGRAERIEETSRFLQVNGCWLYLDGKVHEGDPQT